MTFVIEFKFSFAFFEKLTIPNLTCCVKLSTVKAGEPVWFGCDVSKFFSRKRGILAMDIFDYELVFGTKVNVGLSKADRLIYGDCAMNHGIYCFSLFFICMDFLMFIVSTFSICSYGSDRCP